MQQKHFLLISGIALLLTFSSCSTHRYIHSASKPNIAFFDEQGDAKLSGAVGTSGIDAQGAYAVSDNFVVTGSASIGLEDIDKDRKSFNDKKATVEYNRNNFELGIGYILPLNASKTITFNLFGGYGIGKFKINESEDSTSYSKYYDVSTSHWFVQPSFNFMPSDAVHFAIYFKPSFVKYGKVKSDYDSAEKDFFGFDVIHDETVMYPEFGYDLEVKIPGLSWLYLEHTLSITTWPHELMNTRLHPHNVGLTIGLSAKL